MSERTSAAFGGAAALLWGLFCIRWFDVAEPWRPAWLASLPPLALAAGCLLALALCLAGARRGVGRGPALARPLLLVVALAVAFRLPLAVQGAEGYTTADAALAGIMAVHARDGTAHHVFVPSVSYSGSLKSHLAALAAAAGLDAPRALTLASLVFYAFFVAAVFRLGALVARPGRELATALGAGLWAAFAPTFVTLYSLSNDGNYVEVLAFGSWALVLACRFFDEPARRARLALATGLLLGLAYWSHILAIVYVVAVGGVLLVGAGRRWPLTLGPLVAGFAIGDLPGLLWNARHDWASFLYLVPEHWTGVARQTAVAEAPGALARLGWLISDELPVLFGYDPGYPPLADALSRGGAWLGAGVAFAATFAALVAALRSGSGPLRLLLLFVAVNLGTALLALPYIAGIPRYLLFSFGALAPLVARLLDAGRRRLLLVLLVSFGALGSLGQARVKLAEAADWRGFVRRLEAEGVRHCYSDFYQSARITFLAEERIVCSSKLGPTTTEYFPEYRPRVDAAADVAIVAVNTYSAGRMEKKLGELGVSYERLDLMKPVLLRLSRRVDPSELFPGRDFSPR